MQLASISSVKGNTPFELDKQSRCYSQGAGRIWGPGGHFRGCSRWSVCTGDQMSQFICFSAQGRVAGSGDYGLCGVPSRTLKRTPSDC